MHAVAESPNWQRQRGRLNHDWLRNQMIMHLDGLLAVIDSPESDEEFVEEFVEGVLPRWESQFARICELINRFENEMSPRSVFEHPPLFVCSQESKEWLVVLVHSLWLSRYGIRELLSEARNSAQYSNEAYEELLEALKTEPGDNLSSRLAANRHLLSQFRDKCERLSEVISRFPHRVLVA